MPFSSAQADRSINKLCKALELEFTFVPNDDLYIRNPLECSLDPIAECLGRLEHPTIKVRSKTPCTVGVMILPGSSIN